MIKFRHKNLICYFTVTLKNVMTIVLNFLPVTTVLTALI